MNEDSLKQIFKKLEDHETRIRALEGAKVKVQEARAPVKIFSKQNTTISNPDFSIPIRAFVKKYARSMSGPQKFVLLLAYFSKGERNKNILLFDIEMKWNHMTSKSLLSMKFNRFYPAQAKENDWVESKKQGEYNLRPAWQEIFS